MHSYVRLTVGKSGTSDTRHRVEVAVTPRVTCLTSKRPRVLEELPISEVALMALHEGDAWAGVEAIVGVT